MWKYMIYGVQNQTQPEFTILGISTNFNVRMQNGRKQLFENESTIAVPIYKLKVNYVLSRNIQNCTIRIVK